MDVFFGTVLLVALVGLLVYLSFLAAKDTLFPDQRGWDGKLSPEEDKLWRDFLRDGYWND